MNLFQKSLFAVPLTLALCFGSAAAQGVAAGSPKANPGAVAGKSAQSSKPGSVAKPGVPGVRYCKVLGKRGHAIVLRSHHLPFARLQAKGRALSQRNPGRLVIVEKLQRATNGSLTKVRACWRNGKLLRVRMLQVPARGTR